MRKSFTILLLLATCCIGFAQLEMTDYATGEYDLAYWADTTWSVDNTCLMVVSDSGYVEEVFDTKTCETVFINGRWESTLPNGLTLTTNISENGFTDTNNNTFWRADTSQSLYCNLLNEWLDFDAGWLNYRRLIEKKLLANCDSVITEAVLQKRGAISSTWLNVRKDVYNYDLQKGQLLSVSKYAVDSTGSYELFAKTGYWYGSTANPVFKTITYGFNNGVPYPAEEVIQFLDESRTYDSEFWCEKFTSEQTKLQEYRHVKSILYVENDTFGVMYKTSFSDYRVSGDSLIFTSLVHFPQPIGPRFITKYERYNSHNDLIKEVQTIPTNPGLKGSRYFYSYDENGKVYNEVREGINNKGEWERSSGLFLSKNGCTSANDSLFTSVKIEKPDKGMDLVLYPNPAKDLLYIDRSGKTEAITLNIYNLLGKLVLAETIVGDEPIDISSLSAGSYIVNIDMQGQQATKRLVVLE